MSATDPERWLLANLTDADAAAQVDLTASMILIVVIAGLPLQICLLHCLWITQRRRRRGSGDTLPQRRTSRADEGQRRTTRSDEGQLLARLSKARRVDAQVRVRVTFGTMAVAWACEIVAWGPLTVSWATGVSEADFYALSRIPLPLYGIPAALGPALVLLACRPLDHIGVRLAGAFCCASYLYYVRPHHTHMTVLSGPTHFRVSRRKHATAPPHPSRAVHHRYPRLHRERLARRRRVGLGAARDGAALAAALRHLLRLARLGDRLLRRVSLPRVRPATRCAGSGWCCARATPSARLVGHAAGHDMSLTPPGPVSQAPPRGARSISSFSPSGGQSRPTSPSRATATASGR